MIKSTAALAACLALIAFVAPTPAQAFTATAHASLTDLCKNKDGKEATEKPAGATSITFGKDCESGCKGKKGEKTEKDPVSITFGKDCDSGCKGKKGEKTEKDPVSITFGKDCDSGCKGKKGEKTETDAG